MTPFNKILKKARQSTKTESKSVVTWGWGERKEGRITKEHEKTFEDGYVHNLDCDDDFTGIRIRQNVSDCIF